MPARAGYESGMDLRHPARPFRLRTTLPPEPASDFAGGRLTEMHRMHAVQSTPSLSLSRSFRDGLTEAGLSLWIA
jgi:hypothetical protein